MSWDYPYHDPEPVEEECFPVEHDIEYVGGLRVTRSGAGWKCEHSRWAPTPEAAAANCVQYCATTRRPSDDTGYSPSDPKHPAYHSTHADIWDLREKG